MKKAVLIILSLCFSANLCSCGMSSEIPDESMYVTLFENTHDEIENSISLSVKEIEPIQEEIDKLIGEDVSEIGPRIKYDSSNKDANYGEEFEILKDIVYHFEDGMAVKIFDFTKSTYEYQDGSEVEPGYDHYYFALKFKLDGKTYDIAYFCTPGKDRYRVISGNSPKSVKFKKMNFENKSATIVIGD